MKKILAIAGAILTIGSLIGMAIAVDSRYARTEYVAQIEYRLDQKIVQDRAAMLQERMWRLEDRYGVDKARFMDEYRRLKAEYDDIVRKIKGR